MEVGNKFNQTNKLHRIIIYEMLLLFQARLCNYLIHCWNLYISICWHGRFRHWQMEKKRSQVVENFSSSHCKSVEHELSTNQWFTILFLMLIIFLNTLPCWSSIGTSVAVSSTLIALVLIGRAAFVFPIANITNCIKTRESTKIEFRSQVIIVGL